MDNRSNPLVSIVFTSYNHKEYLKQALNSLFEQTYRNLEIIIVDDCSTDGSQEILKEYAHYTNLTLILSDVNSGSYVKASNYGASFATGEYILFAQCDDFSEIDQIEKLVQVFKQNPSVGVVFSKSNLIDELGIKFSDDFICRERKFKKKVEQYALINGDEMKQFLSFSCVIPNLSAALIKHHLFKEIKGLSDKFLVVADWEFWLKLSEKTDFYYISLPLNNFRQHATTIRSKIKIETQIYEVYAMFYNHIALYQLTIQEQRKIKVGAGAVWFSYFLENKKLWIQSFPSVYSRINKIEKRCIYYVIVGAIKHLVEFIFRKMDR